ncbi:unnamed protein product, partial [Rotaria magnacalcarata]
VYDRANDGRNTVHAKTSNYGALRSETLQNGSIRCHLRSFTIVSGRRNVRPGIAVSLYEMAGTYDNEQQRMIDRIKCIAFRGARDVGATFINRQWISDKIHRTTRFITDWWNKSYDQCFADYSNKGCISSSEKVQLS